MMKDGLELGNRDGTALQDFHRASCRIVLIDMCADGMTDRAGFRGHRGSGTELGPVRAMVNQERSQLIGLGSLWVSGRSPSRATSRSSRESLGSEEALIVLG